MNVIEALVAQRRITDVEGELARFEDDLAQLDIAVAEADIARAQAQLLTAQAVLARAEEDQRRHRLTPPAGWTVLERLAEPGALVGPGALMLPWSTHGICV